MNIKVNPDFCMRVEPNGQQIVETLAAHVCALTGHTRGKLLERLGEFICLHCGEDTTKSPCYCTRDD